MKVNENITHLGDRTQREFKAIEKWLIGKGIDVGCGTNRLSPNILAIDQQGDKRYSNADVVWNCKDLEIKETVEWQGKVYSFTDDSLDFIFSSHCLEDFEDVNTVFINWWKKIKPQGLMILLLPDMEICDCELCKTTDQTDLRIKESRSARYWTVEDYERSKKGNPSHKTNVGLKYVSDMLKELGVDYEVMQSNTIEHDKSCTIDIVIKKK